MLTAVPRLTGFLYAVRRCSRDFKPRSVRSPPHPLVSKPTLTDPVWSADALGMRYEYCIKSTFSRWTGETSELCHNNNCCVRGFNRLLRAPSESRTDSSSFRARTKNSNGWRCERGSGGLVVKRLPVAQSWDAVWVVHSGFFLKHPVGHRAEVGR